jgi:AraC-like DNA-binding protein/mannose-6-phosphate isomerase-like protein (cupin superfamily)
MLSISKAVRFKQFSIDHLVDKKGRYLLELEPAFPLSVEPYSFRCEPERLRLNWHERLEIFVAVEGEGEFLMGNEAVRFRQGDILIVDNMKHHGLGKIYGKQCRAISISFLPELVYSPGAPLHAFALLVPFYSHSKGILIVHNADRAVAAMHRTVAQLVNARFDQDHDQPGCYVFLLELLYLLSRHFSNAVTDYSEYQNHQYRVRRLAKLLQYILENHAEHIPVEKGAEMAAMSVSRFMRFFKATTGMTFVSYLTHVRVNHAAELLRNPEHNVGSVAAATGFSDQSYFGRVFRQQFGISPTKFRLQAVR